MDWRLGETRIDDSWCAKFRDAPNVGYSVVVRVSVAIEVFLEGDVDDLFHLSGR
jgi:hypothetical protein